MGRREGANTRDRQGEVSYHSRERHTVITQDVLGKHTSAVSMPILMFSLFLLEDFLLIDSVNEYSKHHDPFKETEDVQYDLC